MHVIMVRHGRAKSSNEHPERPLTAEGEASIEKLGNLLNEKSLGIQKIWHSGILRAKQTAEILSKKIHYSGDLIEMITLSPESNPNTMHIALNAEMENVLIVSHLPFLEYLYNLMITGNMEGNLIHFSPGSATKLVKINNQWNQEWFLKPE